MVFAALLGLATMAAAPLAARSEAQEVVFEGLRFERNVRVAGVDLRLNGIGLRAVAWLKGFAAALYIDSAAADATQVVAMPGPKRLQLRMLQDVPAAALAKAFHSGVSRNADPEELPRLAERIARFEAQIDAIGTLRKGDTVDLDLDPAQGTLLGVNGTLRGEALPGADFYAALLRSFVGNKPYDERLKAGLLGGAT
jgi:hypothetical protein